MKKIYISLIMALMVFLPLISQDCNLYYPAEIGAVRELTSYDKKDKVTSKVVQEITDFQKSGSNVEIQVKSTVFDDKGEQIAETEIRVGCENGTFKMDMSDYISQLVQQYQSMEVILTGDDLVFPSKMKQGDELPEGKMNIKVNSEGITLMNMDVTITDRKVEAIENVTTPAGSFECYKISYTTIAKTRILTITTSAIEWISENVGVVKSESFSKNGKSTGYTLLTDLK